MFSFQNQAKPANSCAPSISQKTTSSDEDFTTLISGVPYGTGETFFARFGNWFSWLCAALALA